MTGGRCFFPPGLGNFGKEAGLHWRHSASRMGSTLQTRLATSGLLEDGVLGEKMPRSIWNDKCAPSIRTLVMGVVASFLRSGSLKSSMKQRGRIKGAEGDLMES